MGSAHARTDLCSGLSAAACAHARRLACTSMMTRAGLNGSDGAQSSSTASLPCFAVRIAVAPHLRNMDSVSHEMSEQSSTRRMGPRRSSA
eukprot:5543541-Pleurochrysis_carterae.AAC.1